VPPAERRAGWPSPPRSVSRGPDRRSPWPCAPYGRRDPGRRVPSPSRRAGPWRRSPSSSRPVPRSNRRGACPVPGPGRRAGRPWRGLASSPVRSGRRSPVRCSRESLLGRPAPVSRPLFIPLFGPPPRRSSPLRPWLPPRAAGRPGLPVRPRPTRPARPWSPWPSCCPLITLAMCPRATVARRPDAVIDWPGRGHLPRFAASMLLAAGHRYDRTVAGDGSGAGDRTVAGGSAAYRSATAGDEGKQKQAPGGGLFLCLCPAASYSPTRSPAQYHRRWWA
jgi:hypothetical protein